MSVSQLNHVESLIDCTTGLTLRRFSFVLIADGDHQSLFNFYFISVTHMIY